MRGKSLKANEESETFQAIAWYSNLQSSKWNVNYDKMHYSDQIRAWKSINLWKHHCMWQSARPSPILEGKAKFFSTIDASQGYWQLELEEKSQVLTTFMTPYNRYAFLRAPMSLNCTGDEYCRRGDKVFEEINNLQKVVDDILCDDDIEQHVHNIRKFLKCCRKNNVNTKF